MHYSNYHYEIKEGIKRIKYENIYLLNNKFYFLTQDKKVDLQEVKLLGGPEHTDFVNENQYLFKPNIKYLSNENEIKDFLLGEIIEIKGIVNFFSHYYNHNVGHGLYDAIYPSFLTFLNYCNNSLDYTNLINILHVPEWISNVKCSKEWLLEIMEKFSGKKNLILNNLDKNKIYKFQILLAGSGYAGISAINRKGIMPGKELNALAKFRNRFYQKYNICIENTKELNITIVDSDRYTDNDKEILLKINNELNNLYKCSYINWKDIDSFDEHLNIMSNTDIYISSPGTSGNYFPFLREKSIFINLGTNISGEYNIKQLMEVNMALLSNDILIDYYDIFKEDEYKYNEINKLVNKNINLHSKITLENNIVYEPKIPNYIKIWQELFSSNNSDLIDKENLDELIQRMNNDLKPDFVGYRYPEICIQNYKIENKDLDFLNKTNSLYLDEIKKKYKGLV